MRVQGVRRRISGLGRPAPARAQPYTHLLCISPDAPTNPVLYWLGNMAPQGTRFLLDGAKGPLHLDLGDVLYAPNIMVDHKVQCLLAGDLRPGPQCRGPAALHTWHAHAPRQSMGCEQD